ncbi:MAG: hypothetical protein ACLSAP_10410 [Oscillospiraceae bacterium]
MNESGDWEWIGLAEWIETPVCSRVVAGCRHTGLYVTVRRKSQRSSDRRTALPVRRHAHGAEENYPLLRMGSSAAGSAPCGKNRCLI